MYMHRRGSRFGKAVMILLFATACIAAFSFIVMSLWNAILPAVVGIKAITFWQAMGILVLSKILFGGFGGGGWGGRREHFKNKWRQKMQEKWQHMTPEERQQFKEQWKARCGNWGRRFNEENFKTNESAGAE